MVIFSQVNDNLLLQNKYWGNRPNNDRKGTDNGKYRVTNRDMGGYVTRRDKKSKVSPLQTHLLFYLLGRLNFPISQHWSTRSDPHGPWLQGPGRRDWFLFFFDVLFTKRWRKLFLKRWLRVCCPKDFLAERRLPLGFRPPVCGEGRCYRFPLPTSSFRSGRNRWSSSIYRFHRTNFWIRR